MTRATAAEKRHMDKVAGLPCALCAALGEPETGEHGPMELHHLREGQGVSQRASNFLVIPLHRDCHKYGGGLHGDRSLLRVAKTSELDMLAWTIEMLGRGR